MTEPTRPLTAEEVGRLRESDAQATKGPWHVHRAPVNRYLRNAYGHYVMESTAYGVRLDADAEFIAAMRNALPQLLQAWEEHESMITPEDYQFMKERAERAEAERDALRQQAEMHRASNARVLDGLKRIAKAIGDDELFDLDAVHILGILVEHRQAQLTALRDAALALATKLLGARLVTWQDSGPMQPYGYASYSRTVDISAELSALQRGCGRIFGRFCGISRPKRKMRTFTKKP